MSLEGGPLNEIQYLLGQRDRLFEPVVQLNRVYFLKFTITLGIIKSNF